MGSVCHYVLERERRREEEKSCVWALFVRAFVCARCRFAGVSFLTLALSLKGAIAQERRLD